MRTDILQGQDATLAYNLIATSDGFSPLTGETSGTTVLKYRSGAETGWNVKSLSGSNFREIGEGQYEVDFSGAELGTLGPFYSVLVGSDGSSYYREDEIALPALAGVLLATATSGSVAIPGVTVQIRDAADIAQIARGTTDVDGELFADLPPGDYNVHLHKLGWSFAGAPFLLTVTGDDEVTYVGTAQSIANPGSPDTFVLSVYLIRSDGTPRNGIEVTVAPIYTRRQQDRHIGVSSTGLTMTNAAQTATTDVDGFCSFALVPSSACHPSFLQYKVTAADQPTGSSTITMPAEDTMLESVL